ncbi:hypothetical protein KKB28_06870 [bacterium]|nr:hypothetical protein [bacterium]
MSKRIFLTLFIAAIGTICFQGCSSSDDGDDSGEHWRRSQVLDFGQRPVPSPDGERICFATEGTGEHPAGIYLLEGDSVVQLTNGTPPHAWDYNWSSNGARIAFSAPGQIGGESAGIWVINITTRQLEQIWDRGSSPSWDPVDSLRLYCAGPEDGTDNEGIFLIVLEPALRIRVQSRGTSPLMSPNRMLLGCQLPGEGSQGRALYVATLDSLSGMPVASHTGAYSWVWDSQQIIYEFIDGGALDFYSVSVSSPGEPQLLITRASFPHAFRGEDKFVFAKVSGASAGGICTMSTHGGDALPLTATGTRPVPTSTGDAIYFDDEGGIYILRRTS